MNLAEISKLKVPELKKELKIRGLSTAGNKNELMERLLATQKSATNDLSSNSVDDLEDDLLKDEDDEHIDHDENDSVLTDLDTTISDTTVIEHEKAPKRKSLENIAALERDVGVAKPKKIILNRTPSIPSDTGEAKPTASTATKQPLPITTAVETSNGTKKTPVKLIELSAKERMEMRAKKFGAPLPDVVKKQNRAERFGSAVSSPISNTVNTSSEVLKKRAERFGLNNGAADSSRLELRKARFSAEDSKTVVPTVNPSENDKMKLKRLERFKQST